MVRKITAIAALSFLAGAACVGDDDAVRVELDEYSVEADPATSSAGPITFRVRNVGSIAHQFQVLRTNRPPDGLRVRRGVADVEDRGVDLIDELDLVASDDAERLEVDLDRGSYLLICNIAGHYDNGMRARFRVGPRS